MSKLRLEGKVAIITGAASGIGEAAARLFAENGALVIVADIQDELGLFVVNSIGQERSSYKHCDVKCEHDVEDLVAYALNEYGRLDIMFSNAGIMDPASSIRELDMQELANTFQVNVGGAAAAIKHAGRAMVEHQIRGSIICTASIAASVAGIAPHVYTVSKHALVGLAQSASSELGKYGIRVNCISPSGLATPLSCKLFNIDVKMAEAASESVSNLKGMVLKPKDVAKAALFLASDESAYVSGHNLAIDGGFSVVNHCFHVYD